MFKKNLRLTLAMVVIALVAFSSLAGAAAPKYVFYFIGDGLGAAQRQAAEYFLQEQTGNPDAKLVMNQFPIAGINTTHSLDTLVTDSAAAATALAAGVKTNNGIIAQLPDGTNVKTLIEACEDLGMATGIVSTTRLTHATPAAFASHNQSRNNEAEIAADFIDSGVDYFAGGGYRYFVPKSWEWGKSSRNDELNVAQEFYNNNYHVFLTENDTAKFREFQPTAREKVFAVFTYSHMPYEIERAENVPSVAELTAKGIDILDKYNKGFFMMVEGGRIDHACHANDAPGSIHDTLAFDDAIAEAYEFYKKHPAETLIVIVGDHETGGMGLGFGSNYYLNMNELVNVRVSVEDTLQSAYTGDRAAFYQYIAANCDIGDLTAAEKATIEKAMDIVDNGTSDSSYGGYNPVAIAVAHITSERANLYWTTYAHSGTAIPMSAIGVGAESFGGFKDNTEIAKAMAKLLSIKL